MADRKVLLAPSSDDVLIRSATITHIFSLYSSSEQATSKLEETTIKITSLTLAVGLAFGSSAMALSQSAPKIRWMTYRSDLLHVHITVPAAWVAKKSEKALAFHSPGDLKIRAGVGLMRTTYEGNIDEAADALTATEGLEGWTRSYTYVAGLQAIQVVGHPKENPKMKMARYFIATPSGPFLLQCVAPAKAWHLYRSLFETIINSIRFA